MPKASILLVDDEPSNLLALEVVLECLGQNLIKAHSGEEALRLAGKEVAVILLDVQMHSLDGYETAKVIRSREETRHTPIIFLTAYDDNRLSVEQAYALGAVDYLVKPLLPVILRAKVTGFVELFKKTQEIEYQAEQLRQLDRREFEHKLAAENIRLRQQKELFRTTLASIGDAVITTDIDGHVTFLNPVAQTLTGWRQNEAIGHPLDAVFPIVNELSRQLVENPVIRSLREGPTIATGRRILVVDDNRDSATSLATLLKLTGNETHTAADGLEAVEAAATFKPDVVLLDIGLPKLNGYEACRRIRQEPWGKGMVLVALTGWGQNEDKQKSREAGFDGHMVKPVDHSALTRLLDELQPTSV